MIHGRLKKLILGVLAAGLLTTSARAEELPNIYDSEIGNAVYTEGLGKIEGLTWTNAAGEVRAEPEFSIEGLKNQKPAARVYGKFAAKNAGTLLFSSDRIQRAQFKNEEGFFSVLIPLSGRKTALKVQYIDDYGRRKSQDVEIVYENFYQFQLTQTTKKKWNFDGGVSFSYLDYTQTSPAAEIKISQMGITPKAGVTYNVNSRLDVGGSVFGTLVGLPMSKTPDGLSTPRFYGLNLRIGYKIYGLRKGNIYLMTGPYFWGMLVPPSPNGLTYGVVKLSGPQLFIVGRFLTNSGRTAVGYLKAASILDGEGGLMQNREYAIGGAYQITPAKRKRRFMANLDFASASFLVTGETIKLNSLSLGVSTSF